MIFVEKYYLSFEDIEKNFFHFTRKSNLSSIKEKGLIPKIGVHAKSLEDTKKVFFVEGLDNLLILFDCWINVCEKYPLVPGMFNIGSKIMKQKWFPKRIMDIYFKYTELNKIHRLVVYKYFDGFLNRYILLNLDIKEEKDFSYDDVDQIKRKGYHRDILIKGGYSELYSDLESIKMDR